MKEEINLLSPTIKIHALRHLLWKRLDYIWRRLFALLAIWLVILSGIGLGFYFTTRFFENSLLQRYNQDTGVQKTVSSNNEFLRQFQVAVKKSTPWSLLLVEILKNMPVEVQLTEVTTRPDDGAILLKGVSNSRTAVIDFQRNLEKVSWISRVEAPLQNFASGQTAGFTFTLFPKEQTAL